MQGVSGTPGFVYALLESNLVHRERDKLGGGTDANSGGTQCLLALVWVGGAINWNQEPPYALVLSWGEKGSGPGQLNDPTGIAITNTEFFVSEARNGRIQLFDAKGDFLRNWGGPFALGLYGPFKGWFTTATSIAIDRVQKFTAQGGLSHRIRQRTG